MISYTNSDPDDSFTNTFWRYRWGACVMPLNAFINQKVNIIGIICNYPVMLSVKNNYIADIPNLLIFFTFHHRSTWIILFIWVISKYCKQLPILKPQGEEVFESCTSVKIQQCMIILFQVKVLQIFLNASKYREVKYS